MSRTWRILRRVLIVLALLLVVLFAILYGATTAMLNASYDFAIVTPVFPSDAAALERGRHLADEVTGCGNCHGPDYGGRMFLDPGPIVGRLAAPNLTRGRGSVIAAYTDADWIRAVRHGISPHGRPLVLMPSGDFARLTADDLGAIIAYVKTRAPVDREWPAPTLGPIGRVMVLANSPMLLPVRGIDHHAPIPTAAPAGSLAKGDQLASISGCRGCHNADLTGGGGPPPGGANLTPTGIGAWSEADFARTLRTGRTPDGRDLDPIMPRFNLTDEELHDLWSYLRTVPAKGTKTARQAGQGR